ncbi:MAG: helix-turn-helix transcriptional regulator [Verrucomicrobia bacterium]|nr:helix-turn-helix transcriptional regulator [Verrucomicrobiota bacterium]
MKSPSKSLPSLLARARGSKAYALEGVKLEFTEQIVALMEAAGVSKAMLAARLAVAPAYVTKVLGGTTNFTLESMAKIARALGAELRLQLKPMKQARELTDKLNGKAVSANGSSRQYRDQNRSVATKAV